MHKVIPIQLTFVTGVGIKYTLSYSRNTVNVCFAFGNFSLIACTIHNTSLSSVSRNWRRLLDNWHYLDHSGQNRETNHNTQTPFCSLSRSRNVVDRLLLGKLSSYKTHGIHNSCSTLYFRLREPCSQSSKRRGQRPLRRHVSPHFVRKSSKPS